MSSDAYDELVTRALSCSFLIGKDRDPQETIANGVATMLSTIGTPWEAGKRFHPPTVNFVSGLSEREWQALKWLMAASPHESVRIRREGLICDLDTIRVFDAIQ